MYRASGNYFERSEIIADVWKAFEEYYEHFIVSSDLTEIVRAYNERLVNCHRRVYIEEPGGKYSGIAEGIDAEGCLLVRKNDGTLIPVMSGEVSVRGVLGYV